MAKSEIVTLFERGKTVTSAFSRQAVGIPLNEWEFFGGIFESKILVGKLNNVFEYKGNEDEWLKVQSCEHFPQHFPLPRRSVAHTCVMKDVHLLCNGTNETEINNG